MRPHLVTAPVTGLGLSERPLNCLLRSGIELVSELIEHSSLELLALRNFGETSLADVEERLDVFGLVLSDHPNADAINAAAGLVAADKSNDNSDSADTLLDIAIARLAGPVPSDVAGLGLSERPRNCLRYAGIEFVSELIEHSSRELLALRNFGETSLADVEERLDVFGLVLSDHPNADAINAAAAAASRLVEEDVALLGIEHLAAWGLAEGYLNLSAVIVDAAAGQVDETFPANHYERLSASLDRTGMSKVDESQGFDGDKDSAANRKTIEVLTALRMATSWALANGYDTLAEFLQDVDKSLIDDAVLQDALLTISSAKLNVLGKPHAAAYDWRTPMNELIDQSGRAHQYRTIAEKRWWGHAPVLRDGKLSDRKQTLAELGLETSLSNESVRQLENKLKDLLLSDGIIFNRAVRLNMVIGDFLSLPMLNAAGFGILSFEDKVLLELASLVAGNKHGNKRSDFHIITAWDNTWISRDPQNVSDLALNEFWANAVDEAADFVTVLIAISRKLLEHETSLTETGVTECLGEAFGEPARNASEHLSTDDPTEPRIDTRPLQTSSTAGLVGVINDPVSAGRRPQRASRQTKIASDGPVHELRKRAEGIVDVDQSLRRRGAQLLLWTGKYADKAVRVLRSEGTPMNKAVLTKEVCGVDNALSKGVNRGALAQIQGDKRIRRVKKNAYGLTEWGDEEYLGIVTHMVDGIKASGDQIAVWQLQQALSDNFGINPDSVSMYASENPKFFLDGDFVRLRKKGDGLDVKPLGECPSIVRIGDRPSTARWALRLHLTESDWFRGAGMPMARSFAVHLGLSPGEEGELRWGTQRIGWYWNNQMTASISNTPELRDQVDGAKDQFLLVIAMGQLKVRLQLLDCLDDDEPALSKLLRVVGADPDATNQLGALAFAIGLDRKADLATVAKQMRKRTNRTRIFPEKALFAEAFPGAW